MKKKLYTHLYLAIMATTLLCACQDFEALDERPVLDTPPTVESVTPRSIVVSRPLPVHDRYLGDGRGRAFIISTNPEMNGRYGNGTYNGYDDTFYGVFDGLRPHTDYYIQYIEGCTCADRDTTVLVASPITKVTTLAYDPVSYQLRLGSGFTKGLSDILGVFSPHGGGYTYEPLIYSKDWMTPKTTIDDERPVYVIYPAPSAASQPESVPVSYTGQTLWLGAQTISPENPSATVNMLPYSANVTLNVTYKAASTGTSCTLRGGTIENVTSGGPISSSGTLDLTNGQFTATDGGKNQGYSWNGANTRITNSQKNTTTLTGLFPATFADGQVQVRFQYDGNLENPEATVALPASTWKQGGSYTYNIEAQFSATGVKLSIVDVTIEEWREGERLEGVTAEFYDKTNGHEYVDLGLPSGTLWATCNIGADTPEEYGDYFAWGETEPDTKYTWVYYKYCNGTSSSMTKYCTRTKDGRPDYKIELDLADDAAYRNWGKNWRMPSEDQIRELENNNYTTIEWTTLNGVNGNKITSKSNGRSLFLPAAGIYDDDDLNEVGSRGYYWSRIVYNESSSSAIVLFFRSDLFGYSIQSRRYGFPVRPVLQD